MPWHIKNLRGSKAYRSIDVPPPSSPSATSGEGGGGGAGGYDYDDGGARNRGRAMTYSGGGGGVGGGGSAITRNDWDDMEMFSSTPNLLDSAEPGRGGKVGFSSSAYACLKDSAAASRLEAFDHSVFVVHQGWKEDTDIVNTLTEKLHGSRLQLSSVTLALNAPKSSVCMAAYPSNRAVADVTVDHGEAMDGFCRALREQQARAATAGEGGDFGSHATSVPRLLALTRAVGGGGSSQTPPVTQRRAAGSAAHSSMSLGKLGGKRFKAKAAEHAVVSDGVRCIVRQFMAAKVVIVLYDRLCQSPLPEPLVALAYLQHKFIVPVSSIGRDSLIQHLGLRGVFSFTCSPFFFATPDARRSKFAGVVQHVVDCLSPGVGSPLSLQAPLSYVEATSRAQTSPTGAATTSAMIEVPTGDLLALTPEPAGTNPFSYPTSATGSSDLLGLSTPPRQDEPGPGCFPVLGALPPSDSSRPLTPPADGDEDDLPAVWLDEHTTGAAMWRCLFGGEDPDQVGAQRLQDALAERCALSLADLFRRDRDREAAVSSLVEACLADEVSGSAALTRDDFQDLVREQMTGAMFPLLEKAMERMKERDTASLDSLLWLLLSSRAAKILCCQPLAGHP